MAELSYGRGITKELAKELGVLDAAEALVKEEGKPIQALLPVDLPNVQSGGDGDKVKEEPKKKRSEIVYTSVAAPSPEKKTIMHDTYGLAQHKLAGGEETPKKEIHHIRTRKTKSGSYIHEHHHTHPEHHPMEEHTSADQDAMVEHMMSNMGSPNPGEAEADAGQSGIPAGAAAPTTGMPPSTGA